MKNRSVLDCTNYKKYVSDRLESLGLRGPRSKLASHLRCQSAYVSQVLNGRLHFSLEHAVLINHFFGHSSEEAHYFLLLIHEARAGSESLKQYYVSQLHEIRERRQHITHRLKVKRSLSEPDQAIYYGSWLYAAIHMMVMVPRFQTKQEIASHLQLSVKAITDAIEFLNSVGLVVQEGNKYRIGAARMHLDSSSSMIAKHHSNWRLRAIQSLDRPLKEDLHFTSIASLSEKDAARIRTIILEFLEQREEIIRPSKDETVFCLGIDFFKI
ncbi:MAG: hypothetical protein A2Z97_08395 [Bdellovibrionales bacterium GWB1_52_6]|nr:MAG: hypothetical protein A2Z97_08395 [Bdellovibrionales bacterium GWB1_52_6]